MQKPDPDLFYIRWKRARRTAPITYFLSHSIAFFFKYPKDVREVEGRAEMERKLPSRFRDAAHGA